MYRQVLRKCIRDARIHTERYMQPSRLTRQIDTINGAHHVTSDGCVQRKQILYIVSHAMDSLKVSNDAHYILFHGCFATMTNAAPHPHSTLISRVTRLIVQNDEKRHTSFGGCEKIKRASWRVGVPDKKGLTGKHSKRCT